MSPSPTAAATPPWAQAEDAPKPSGLGDSTVTGRGASLRAQNRPASPAPTISAPSALRMLSWIGMAARSSACPASGPASVTGASRRKAAGLSQCAPNCRPGSWPRGFAPVFPTLERWTGPEAHRRLWIFYMRRDAPRDAGVSDGQVLGLAPVAIPKGWPVRFALRPRAHGGRLPRSRLSHAHTFVAHSVRARGMGGTYRAWRRRGLLL